MRLDIPDFVFGQLNEVARDLSRPTSEAIASMLEEGSQTLENIVEVLGPTIEELNTQTQLVESLRKCAARAQEQGLLVNGRLTLEQLAKLQAFNLRWPLLVDDYGRHLMLLPALTIFAADRSTVCRLVYSMDPADKRVFQQWAGRPAVADFLKLGLYDSNGASIPGSRWSLAGVNAADVADKVGLKRTQQIEILLAEDSSTLQQILSVPGPALDFNPRRVKQFTNIFRLRALIAAETGTFEQRADDRADVSPLTLQQLAKFVVIGQKWPLFLAAVSEDQGLLGWIQREACDLPNSEGHGSPINSYWGSRSDVRNALRLGCCGSENAEDDRPDLWSLADINIDRILQVSGQVRRLVTQDVSVTKPANAEPVEQETNQPNVAHQEEPITQPNSLQQERPVVLPQDEVNLEPLVSNQEEISLNPWSKVNLKQVPGRPRSRWLPRPTTCKGSFLSTRKWKPT